MKNKGFIFDMDGLLIDSEQVYLSAWTQACQKHGYTLPKNIFSEMLGHQAPWIDMVLKKAFGKDFPVNQVREDRKAIFNCIIEEQGIPLRPGALEMLDKIENLGLPFALATSTKQVEVTKRLAITGLSAFFKANQIVTGDMVKLPKPDPEIYCLAASKIDIDITNIVVFEDSSPGVLAASSAGASVFMIPHLHSPTQEICSRCVYVGKSLLDALDYMEKAGSYFDL
jgi:HAD superfamily hydrolase (TIGR01509 family)